MEIVDCLLCNSSKKGGSLTSSNNILDIISKNKNEWINAFKEYHKMSKDDIINHLKGSARGGAIDEENDEEELNKERDITKGKAISAYTVINILTFLKSEKGLYYQGKKKDQFENLVNKKLFEYDPFETAFEKNYDKYRDYQKNIIEHWSISYQELLILYYGVGTGKTIVATTCAEEFSRLNPDSSIYFLLPASLVFNTISLMFHYGIDPTIKFLKGDKKGQYIYNFTSYQQMIRSQFDFTDNSLLIIDEIHNLRNLTTEGIKVKVKQGQKWADSGQLKLVGNVLSRYLLLNSKKVIKKIFMTGTLFVNGPEDLESIISLGYNKFPYLNYDKETYDTIMKDDAAFKNYYQGLIAFYRIGGENLKLMPSVKYHFISIDTKDNAALLPAPENDKFLIETRTFGSKEKIEWVIKFLLEHSKEKTLLYVQFLDRQITPLEDLLKKNKIDYGIITGKLNAKQKQQIIDDYNNDNLKLIIFSLAIKEGISFKETNNFIVFTPYWNYAITEQVIARAIRLDSHKLGDKSLVNVYLPLMNSIADSNRLTKKMNVESYYEEEEEVEQDEDMTDAEKARDPNYVYDDIWGWINNRIQEYIPRINKPKQRLKKHRVVEIGKDELSNIQSENTNLFIKYSNHIFNDINIKNFKDYVDLHNSFKYDPRAQRDIDMYMRMFKKMASINIFEERLLKLPSFQDVNNLENNDFTIEFNKEILEMQNKGKGNLITKEFKTNLKIKLYNVLYKDYFLKNTGRKGTIDISLLIPPYTDDNLNVPDLREDIRKIRDEDNTSYFRRIKKSLDLFDIDKGKIQRLNAFFTPSDNVSRMIELSGITNDNRDNIKVLEPTAGVGDIISQLNISSLIPRLLIDAVEYSNMFWQIGSVLYEKIDNVKWHNMDFFKYVSRYNYDYVFMNPPFNIKSPKGNNIYDVQFVEKAYNMLEPDGVLVALISNRFTYDNSIPVFKKFREALDSIRSIDPDYVIIENCDTGFKDTHIPEMKTAVKMVYLVLGKIEDIAFIELSDKKLKPIPEPIPDPEPDPEPERSISPVLDMLDDVSPPIKRKAKPKPKPEPKPKSIKIPKGTTECPEGKVRNPKTGRCIKAKIPKECKEGKVRNPATGRCVKANSKTLKKK
jgi:superfamily II DNA or RNA helicase